MILIRFNIITTIYLNSFLLIRISIMIKYYDIPQLLKINYNYYKLYSPLVKSGIIKKIIFNE